MNDPIVTVSVWRGQQSALAARLGIAPVQLAALVNRLGLKRGGSIELPTGEHHPALSHP